jgi:glycosyltransferase involved in cell wall biosynthesis
LADIEIIFPCFRPPAGWADHLYESCQKIKTLLPGRKIAFLIVDDGSPNPEGLTSEFADLRTRMPDLRVERYELNRGKGFALRHGVSLSQAPLCVFTDIDCPYEEKSVAGLCEALERGPDIVPGHRETDYYERVRLDRTLISKFVRFLLRLMFKLNVTDTQCGLKGFNRRGREIFLRTKTNRYLFDLEFLCLAALRPDINVSPYTVRLKDNVIMTKFGAWALFLEGLDFLRIWTRLKLGRSG